MAKLMCVVLLCVSYGIVAAARARTMKSRHEVWRRRNIVYIVIVRNENNYELSLVDAQNRSLFSARVYLREAQMRVVCMIVLV